MGHKTCLHFPWQKKKRKGKKKKIPSPPLSKQKTTVGSLHHMEAFVVWEGRDVQYHEGIWGNADEPNGW